MKLSEGLRSGDLDGLILPLLTIDEYASKIDDNKSIVVGFYVFEENAAHDLSNFVEREPYLVLDTDVSPAPTKDGYYVCFAELGRTPDFPEALMKVLSDVSRLCGIDNWQFTCAKLPKDKITELTDENLQKYVDCEVRDAHKQKEKDIMEFFQPSSLNRVVLENKQLKLLRRGVLNSFEFEDIGDLPPKGAVDLTESAAGQCLRLQNFLGGPYSVNRVGATIVVENFISKKFLILTA